MSLRESSDPTDLAPSYEDYIPDRLAEYGQRLRNWRKREARRGVTVAALRLAVAAAGEAKASLSDTPKVKGLPTDGGDPEIELAFIADASMMGMTTSTHAERLNLPLILGDATLAAEWHPPTLAPRQVASELLKPGDSPAKLWYWQMTGDDWGGLSILDARRAWRQQYSRWWKMVKQDKYNETLRESSRDRTGRVRPTDQESISAHAARVLQRWTIKTKQLKLQADTEQRRFCSRKAVLEKLMVDTGIDARLYCREGFVRTAHDWRLGIDRALLELLRVDLVFERPNGVDACSDDEGFVQHLARECQNCEIFHLLEITKPAFDTEQDLRLLTKLEKHKAEGCPRLDHSALRGCRVSRGEDVWCANAVLSTLAFELNEVRADPKESVKFSFGFSDADSTAHRASVMWNLGCKGALHSHGYRFEALRLSPIWLTKARKWVGNGDTRLTFRELEALRAQCVLYLTSESRGLRKDYINYWLTHHETGSFETQADCVFHEDGLVVRHDACDLNSFPLHWVASFFGVIDADVFEDKTFSVFGHMIDLRRRYDDARISDDEDVDGQDEHSEPDDTADRTCLWERAHPKYTNGNADDSDNDFRALIERELSLSIEDTSILRRRDGLLFYLRGIQAQYRGRMYYHQNPDEVHPTPRFESARRKSVSKYRRMSEPEAKYEYICTHTTYVVSHPGLWLEYNFTL